MKVNGETIRELGTRVDPDTDKIAVDGRPIATEVPKFYLAMYKPVGVVTTCSDPHAERTVIDVLRPALEGRFGRGHPAVEGLHPVGRLDADSEGLLFLTNDGAFTHILTHPRHHVGKSYMVDVQGIPSEGNMKALREGIVIEGRKTTRAYAWLREQDPQRNRARIELRIREGRNRQVRLMMAALGLRVTRLVRTKIGTVALGAMKPGQWRHLDRDEVESFLNPMRAKSE